MIFIQTIVIYWRHARFLLLWLKSNDQISYDSGIVEFIDVEKFSWFHSTASTITNKPNKKKLRGIILTYQNHFVFSSSFENELKIFTTRQFPVLQWACSKTFFPNDETEKINYFIARIWEHIKTVDNFMYGKICMFQARQATKKNYKHTQLEFFYL